MLIGTYLAVLSKEEDINMKNIASLVKDWETKSNRNLAKASGISMMALSLAACGGGSAPAPVVVVEVVPITSALTIWNDTVAGTTADDVVTGARIDTVQVFNSGDSIVLGDGNDSLSAKLNAGTVTPVAMTGVENVMFTVLGDATVDFDNVSGVTSIISRGSSATLLVDDIQEIPTSISINNNTAVQTFVIKDATVSGATDSIT